MHIAFVTSEYPPIDSGGIGISIQTLARELVHQGHQVTVLGIGKQKNWLDSGVKVRFLSETRLPKMGWSLNRLKLAREINKMVINEGLDIVEFPDWTGLSAGMKINCPLVIRCHGSDTYFGSLLGYRPRWSVYWAEKIALHQAHAVVAVSRFAAETTRRIFRLQKPIGVIPNGINLEDFQPARWVQEDSSTVLYFGTLARKKGVLDLADIFSQVAAKNPSAKLILVGRDSLDRQTGTSTWQLFQQKVNANVLRKIEFIGPKSPDEVTNFIHQASICVFPSYAETFGLAWVEAMACAKPVVASNIGWANEIIEDGVSGTLIHPSEHTSYANAILDLLDNPEKRKRIGQNARGRVERLFSIQKVAELSLNWYSEVINVQN